MLFFFFNDTATTEIYTLSLHDALPISIVTVHDLMPVIILRSPTDGWREGVRNRFLRGTLKALRLARAYIVGTEWLKRELATWLGDDRRISVVPFGVDRAFFSEAPNARARGRAGW